MEPSARPAKEFAVVTCMDARLDPYEILGLEHGDAHVIRNAGGIVTDDVIRSLAISQRLLGTREVVLIQHTGCGLLTISDEDFARGLREETGTEPDWSAGAFLDLDENVRASVARLEADPFTIGSVRGYVYELEAGRLREVT